nr:hypothetical protein [uncultured Dyadobacter sp.]
MEKYFNQYAISLAISLTGCISYIVFATIKKGIQSLQEREVAVVFFDFIAICSAVKIVYLAFDVTICRPESKVDLAFLALGGLMIMLIAIKNIVSKFGMVNSA